MDKLKEKIKAELTEAGKRYDEQVEILDEDPYDNEASEVLTLIEGRRTGYMDVLNMISEIEKGN